MNRQPGSASSSRPMKALVPLFSIIGLILLLIPASGTAFAAPPTNPGTPPANPGSSPPRLAIPHNEPHRNGSNGSTTTPPTTTSATASSNWSGYAVSGGFSQAAGQWTVPSIVANNGTYASNWVGVGGFGTSSLIQTGTTEEDYNGTLYYFAWYEIVPSNPNTETFVFYVNPGDRMSGQVHFVSTGVWNISITDNTTGQSYNHNFGYSGATNSAEWIDEAPGGPNGVLPLANYGTDPFAGAQANGGNPGLNTNEEVYIPNLSTPSAPSPPNNAFAVAYGATAPHPPSGVGIASVPGSYNGYWITGNQGDLYGFNATSHGSTGATHLNQPVVAMAATPSGGGYWQVAADGGIFTFGNAGYYGSTGGTHLNKPIVGMAATPNGGGYWLVGADGGIFTFGNAGYHGSTGSTHLNAPIVGMAATPDGGGYWLVAADGGIFTFGDAHYYGSTGSTHLNAPVVGMAATPNGGGYWLVAADGGIFTFGNAGYYGSTGSTHLNAPVVGMARTPNGGGYWLVAADGGLFDFGNAGFSGSASGYPL